MSGTAANHDDFEDLHEKVEALRTVKYGARLAVRAEAIATLMSEQGGRCAVCSSTVAMQLDHDHRTGMVRGMLCRSCNAGSRGMVDHPAAWDRFVAAPPARDRWAFVSSRGVIDPRRPTMAALHRAVAGLTLGIGGGR